LVDCSLQDPAFKAICEEYAADYDLFEKEFTTNFKKLTELGTQKQQPWNASGAWA